MAQPTTREEFKQFCLRKLGHPVIEINVSDEQLEDRIDEALSFWRDYFYDGSEHVYVKHTLTQLDIDQGYIELPQRLLGVVKVFDLSTSMGSGMFDVEYQFALNNIHDISSYNIQHYYMSMQHISLLKEVLSGAPIIRYNRHANRLHIDVSKGDLRVGDIIMIEGYDIIDGGEFSDAWSDRWLQNYATVLIQEAWGRILTKFTGVQLMGGVQFNGEQILSEARDEKRRMEDEAINSLQPIVSNFIG